MLENRSIADLKFRIGRGIEPITNPFIYICILNTFKNFYYTLDYDYIIDSEGHDSF